MTEMSPTFALRSKDLEITRLKIVIDSYAESCAAAAREIAELRERIQTLEAIKPALSDSAQAIEAPPCPYVVGKTTLHCSLTPLTLTDAEREAIDYAAYAAEQWYEHTAAATLRGLLERSD
jgi:hypothetical protein